MHAVIQLLQQHIQSHIVPRRTVINQLFNCITHQLSLLLLSGNINIKPDSLCTGFDLLLVSLRRRLSLHDDDGTDRF